jgi:hypothetical protein
MTFKHLGWNFINSIIRISKIRQYLEICIKRDVVIKSLLSLSIFITILLLFIFDINNAFATSPSFVRSEIDDMGNDTIITNKTEKNKLLTEVTHEPLEKVSDSIDSIKSAIYSSNGTILNATIWLDKTFNDKPIGHDPNLSYGMYIDADSNSKTGVGGTDYWVETSWNGKNWTRMISEMPSGNGEARKVLYREDNYSNFFDKEGNSSYIELYLDLGLIGYPDNYRILFTNADFFNGSKKYTTIDYTNWVYIPPPKYHITPIPNSIVLQPGEENTIQLKATSTTGLRSMVNLSTINAENITGTFITNRTTFSPSGWTFVYLKVKASNNAAANTYTLPISASIYFPFEKIFGRSSSVVNEYSYVTVTVQNPLPPLEQFATVWNIFGPTIKDFYALIAAIISGTGISALILTKIKKRKPNKKKDKK